MPKKDIIVIGASAGGIDPLRKLISKLPKDFGASIFVVVHTAPDGPGLLGEILGFASDLPTANATDREKIERGRVYVAPPDHHLLIEDSIVRLARGPKENRFRPAIDPLFRSAAKEYGSRVIGIVMSGGLDDGTSGLWSIKEAGGTAIVQDPADAFASSMPESALKHVSVDHCLPASDIAPLLISLVNKEVEEKGVKEMSEITDIEIRIAKEDNSMEIGIEKIGEPSSFTCPECHGSLLQLVEGGRVRFRCHTGHAFSIDSLLSSLSEWIEESLWSSIRSIEESVRLMRHIAEHSRENGGISDIFLKKAEEAQDQADSVRDVVFKHQALNEIKEGAAD